MTLYLISVIAIFVPKLIFYNFGLTYSNFNFYPRISKVSLFQTWVEKVSCFYKSRHVSSFLFNSNTSRIFLTCMFEFDHTTVSNVVMVPLVYPNSLGFQCSQQFYSFVNHIMLLACTSVESVSLLEISLISWQVPVWTYDLLDPLGHFYELHGPPSCVCCLFKFAPPTCCTFLRVRDESCLLLISNYQCYANS